MDYWELMKVAAGKSALGFPVRIEASLVETEDRNRFVVTLENTTDLSVRLELEREGVLCGRSSLPYYEQAIEIDEMPAGRYVLEVAWQDGVW